jgi:hypothetical protein
MKIIKRFLPIMFLVFLFAPAAVGAQQEVTLDELNISFWPEYDRPAMLVIYKIMLSPDVALPVELTFNIPASAGEPNAVAEKGVDGGLYNTSSSREVRGDRALIQFTATTPEVWIEYYDPSLSIVDTQRDFSYSWPGDYAVNNLIFSVQEPVSAQEFTTNPELGAPIQGTDGLAYYEAPLGSYVQGEKVDLSLSYQKNTDNLSVESLYPEPPSGPISQDSAGRANLTDVVPWVAGFLGLILIGGGIFWLFRVRNAGQMAPTSTKRGRRGVGEPIPEIPSDNKIYCHLCGKLAASGDVYCRSCGTRLHNGES